MLNKRDVLDNLSYYRDSYGLIVPVQKDGGDSANRTCAAYCYFKALNLEWDDLNQSYRTGLLFALYQLSGDKPGRYRRHPDPLHWCANQDNFTRDQSIVLQSALVMYNLRGHMWQLFKQRIKRGMFHFSTVEGDDTPGTYKRKLPDPPSPIEVSQFIRGLGLGYILYPVLLVSDMWLLADLAFNHWANRHDFPVQYLPVLLSTLSKSSTPWSLLAAYWFKRTNYEAILTRYFLEAPGTNGLTPLGQLAILTAREL